MFHITESMQAYWIKKNKKKATSDDIGKIESELGITLPSPYVEFITEYGFVLFNHDCNGFDYSITFSDRQEIHQGGVVNIEEVDWLIMGYSNLTSGDVEEGLPAFPKNYLPVGNDAGQGQILVKMDGEDIGSIWYWPYKE